MTEDGDTVWTSDQRVLLDAMLDQLIPASPDGVLPSAGKLGVADFLAARAKDTPGLARLFEAGMKAAAALIADRTPEGVTALSSDDRDAVLYALQAQEPAFFALFMQQSYMGYYTHPTVPPHFGLPDRPPQPLGHKVPPNEDLDALVAPVRGRGKWYREC